MNRLIRLVSFNLDDQKYALLLSAVIRIIRVVEITSLPKAPEIVLGVINMHGLIIPVFDIRKRFRLSGTVRSAGTHRSPSENGEAAPIMERRVFYRGGALLHRHPS